VARVSCDEVTKHFDETTAVDRLTMKVQDGELLVLLGPSGCGKTTVLRMVAGLEELTSGTITIGDQVVNDIDPKDRDVAMVFQSYALYPHLTVARNIEFPLRQRGVDSAERQRMVEDVAGTLSLSELLGRKPAQLSGGQRQRVALARAIVRSPQVFLMDEPLSNLDAALRVQTRADIVALQSRLGTTTLYVTHDQVEAMTMGDRIAVMDRGVLQQVAPPTELYERPANVFVAGFLGSPGMNLLPGRAGSGADGRAVVTVAGGVIAVPESLAGSLGPEQEVIAGVRPESMSLAAGGPLSATVILVELLGAEAHVIARTDDDSHIVVRQSWSQAHPAPGDRVAVDIAPGALALFDAGSGLRLEPAR
jgi:multiple sugar transport system ATP-binding protein